MKPGGAWKRYGRLDGSRAGATARKVWICQRCGLWHQDKKPAGCLKCGVLAVFDFFHSSGEAKKWATYKLLARTGEITELRRQVPLPLFTISPAGHPVKWGELVVDFAYKENGEQRYVDFKPEEGPSPDSVLKMRCLEAQGIIVEIVT